MLLAIDAGNTNTVFAVFDDKECPRAHWRVTADGARTADQYASWILPLLQMEGLSFADITGVVIASVVPGANFHLRRFCEKYVKRAPMFLCDEGTSHGLTITFPNPQSLGADRVANVMAATAMYSVPMILIDFGTATKLEVVDAKGAYIGGIIAPGINLSADALHRATAKLPKIDIIKPDSVIGTDTVSAMRSGVFFGYVSMIEGLVARLKAEMGVDAPFILVTGGLAPLFEDSIAGMSRTDEMLTLKGLRLFFERNTQAKSE